MILIAAFLLSLPISIQSGQSLSVIDALFTAASAVSATGLTTIVVGDVFTTFGLIVLLFVIQFSRQGVVHLVKNVLIMVFIIEIIGFLVITHYLYFSGYFNYREAAMQGLFLAISLTANAGFDIAPNGDSYQMYATDYFMQSFGIILMFFGSVGFWVLAEIKEFIQAKIRRERYKFSYFVKMIFTLHIAFIVIGAVFIFTLESQAFLRTKNLLSRYIMPFL